MRSEYIAGLLTYKYRPEELDLLVEQERRDRAGSRIVADKTFTTSETGELPTYSGQLNVMDKTKAPGETMTTSSGPILCPSLPQLIKAAKLAQMTDTEGVLDVELAPET